MLRNDPMLALSVRHPWALALALGIKQPENRDGENMAAWARRLAGRRIALHASKAVPRETADVVDALIWDYLWPGDWDYLWPGDVGEGQDAARSRIVAECHRTAGCILAVATLDRVIAHGDGDLMNDDGWRTDDRFAFVFRDVVRLAEPVPCGGSLGFWTVPIVPAEAVRRQLARAGRAA